MNIDIDSFSAEVTQELAMSPLEKALPPKLRYRFYKWLKQYRHLPMQQAKPSMVNKTIQAAFEHMSAIKELKKNECMVSAFENGAIRMDFGEEVDPKIKKAAMQWAKKKGLKTIEASIEKSVAAPSYVICGLSEPPKGVCVDYIKYSL
jgi:hypothetical protein